MSKKEYRLVVKLPNSEKKEFIVKEPLIERNATFKTPHQTPFIDLIGKETKTRIMLKKSCATQLLSEWTEPKRIDLIGKTANIVMRVQNLPIPGLETIKFVYKSGTSKRVVREFHNYCLFSRVKGIRTLHPLGFAVDFDAKIGFLFTLFERNVVPLSSINYTTILSEQRHMFIRKCMEEIAIMHAHNITHNDLKLKNFLHPKGTGPLFIVDAAKMNFSKRDLHIQAIRYDILTFVGSAIFHNMIKDYHDFSEAVRIYLKTLAKIRRTEMPRPHETKLFVEKMKEYLPLHPTDKNIQNLQKIL